MAHRFRGGRKSERIMVKYSFSRFKNTAADPIILDFDDSVEDLHSEQPPMNEYTDLVIDLDGEDEPQKMESMPVSKTDTSSNEVVEVLMAELSMADNINKHTDASENVSFGKYTILIESTSRCTRSSSRLRHLASGSSCDSESLFLPAVDDSLKHKSQVKLEGADGDAAVAKTENKKPHTTSPAEDDSLKSVPKVKLEESGDSKTGGGQLLFDG